MLTDYDLTTLHGYCEVIADASGVPSRATALLVTIAGSIRFFPFPRDHASTGLAITVVSMDAISADHAADPAESIASTRRSSFPLVSRHLMNIAILMVVPMLVAGTLNRSRTLLVDPDIWWHLANARILCTAHHMIHTDPYSFTAVGQKWLDWEWLSQLPYWFSYKAFGLRGIYLVTWLALCANILFTYWRGYRRSQHVDAALCAAVLAFILMTVNSGPRMIAFAYLAMSAEMAILDAVELGKTRMLWLLPPLFCLWINLHGSWLIGLGLFALYIVCGLFSLELGAFEQRAFSSGQRNRLLIVFAVCAVAPLLNPYGWHLMWNPIDMMLNQHVSIATIAEWQPLDLSSFEGKGALVAVALMVIANCISARKWKAYELAIVFLAWYMAVAHHRFTYLAAVLTTPLLAMDLKRAFFSDSDLKTIPAMNALMVAGAIGAMVYMFPTDGELRKMQGMMFPVQTIASIQPGWRTLNSDYVGGMMAFEGKPSFIDSRFDSFEHLGVMEEFRSIEQGRNSFALMDKYRIDHVLMKDDSTLAYLVEHAPGWRVLSREKAWSGNYVLLARDDQGSGSSPAESTK